MSGLKAEFGRGCVETRLAREYAELSSAVERCRSRGRRSGRWFKDAPIYAVNAIRRAHAPANCIAFIVLTNPSTLMTRLRL